MATDPTQLIYSLLSAGQTTGQSFAQGQQNAADVANAQQENAIRQAQFENWRQQQQDAAAQADQYQHDIAAWTAAGSKPQGLTDLIAKYPDQYKALQATYADKSDAETKDALGFWGGLHGYLDAGDTKSAAALVQQRLAAEKAAGIDTTQEQALADQLAAGDPQTTQGLKAYALSHVAAATGPDKFSDAYGTVKGDYTLTPGASRYDAGNNLLAHAATEQTNALEVPVFDSTGRRVGTRLIPNGGRGGDPASVDGGTVDGSGGPARDTSRLLNTDAGGGNIPDGVQTLGQFVNYGRILNARGAKSSSAGTYQINGSTMSQFAPQALGPNWQSQPFNADSQDKVGQAIFNWAKQQPNPAAALRGRWVSLSPAKAAQLVQGTWQQARGTIAQGETGGAPGSSANATTSQSSDPNYVGPVGSGNAGDDDSLTGSAYAATLNPGRRNLVQAIIDGRAPAPRPGSRFGEALAEDVARVDPTADATTLPIRQKTRQEFSASGKQGQAMQAYNRFAAHLNSAYAIHRQLAGTNLGPLSGLAAGAAQSFTPGLVSKYNTEIEGLQGEFQKLTKLGVANEGESERLIANARPNQSSAGRLGALQGMASLVAGAYQPAVQGWQAAFPGKPLPIDVTPQAKAAINNVIHGGSSALPTGPNGAPLGHARGFVTEGNQGSPIPPSAVQYLRQNPQLRGQFDAKYGKGASALALGR